MLLILGPCSLESEKICREVAATLVTLRERHPEFRIYFKGSFDKANRTSLASARGPGLDEGLALLALIKREYGLPVVTDIHLPAQAAPVAEVCDVLQIPAFLCRQTDLLTAAAHTGRIVNVKKGQFLSPFEMEFIVRKLEGSRDVETSDGGASFPAELLPAPDMPRPDAERLAAQQAEADRLHHAHGTPPSASPGVESTADRPIWLTERGTTFGYQNLVVDMRSFPLLAAHGYPVICDATHAVQLPGAAGGKSGGQREFVETLAKAALAAGADGLFLETHPDPANALSDQGSQIPLADLPALLDRCHAIWQAVS
jgi:2-dehydro-3-deoxyphosphooctonate aldolase (KDO 8-P synthase)